MRWHAACGCGGVDVAGRRRIRAHKIESSANITGASSLFASLKRGHRGRRHVALQKSTSEVIRQQTRDPGKRIVATADAPAGERKRYWRSSTGSISSPPIPCRLNAVFARANSRLQRQRDPRPLIDRPLGVELERDICATDQLWLDSRRFEARNQFAARLLPGANHDRIDREQLRLAVDPDVQSGVVDAVVLDAGQHRDAAALEQCAAYPARRFGQARADLLSLALQQPQLPRRRIFVRGLYAPAMREVGVDAPFGAIGGDSRVVTP